MAQTLTACGPLSASALPLGRSLCPGGCAVLLLLFATAAWGADAGAPDAGSLKETAARLYRAKKYPEACAAYEKALAAEPGNGGLWSDVGVCRARLGHRAGAIEAERTAASLDDPAARLRAYYNLMKDGVRLPLPDEGCAEWPAGGASEKVFVCPYQETCHSGTGLEEVASGLALCPRAADARAFQPECGEPIPGCSAVELSWSVDDRCRAGDVGGSPCGMCSCDEAPDPKACEKAVDACVSRPESHQSQSVGKQCVFVHASAARRLVGAVCDGTAVELSGSLGGR